MYAHGYIRVSSSGQVSGVSPEVQLTALLDYRRERLPDVPWCKDSFASPNPGIFIDLAVSGWSKKTSWIRNRPGGNALMDSLEKGDHVLFYSVDRAFRNVGRFGVFLDWCLQNEVNCHFIQQSLDLSTPSGRMRAQLYAVMAEYYSSILSVRLREAFAVRGKKRSTKKPKKSRLWTKSTLRPAKQVVKDVEQVPGEVFLYGRVSDQKQVDSMLGMAHQDKELDRWFGVMAVTNPLLTKRPVVLDKGISAFKTRFRDRPEGKVVFDTAKRGDHIVACRFDRIFRSVKDMIETVEDFDKRGVTLHLIDDGIRTDDKNSRLYMNMLVSVAEMESEMKSMRQHEVNNELRKQGRPLNGAMPKGTKIAKRRGKLVQVPDIEELIDVYSAMILVEERGMTTTRAGAYMRALRAHRAGEPPTNKFELRHSCVWRKELFPVLFEMRERLPATALESIRTKARAQLEIVLDKKCLKQAGYKEKNGRIRAEREALPF